MFQYASSAALVGGILKNVLGSTDGGIGGVTGTAQNLLSGLTGNTATTTTKYVEVPVPVAVPSFGYEAGYDDTFIY